MLTIRLLGDFAVVRQAERLALPPSKKTRALLAYLVATGRPHRRERLCELLWEVPDDPRGALRWSLSKLRPLVDEPGTVRLQTERDTVALSTDGIQIDLFALRHVIAAGVRTAPLETLTRLAEQSRGEFLEGLDLPNQPGFQAWCIAEREDVRAKRAILLGALVERLAAVPSEAVSHARALVDLDPFAEAPRAMLIRLLAETGRREEAEQHYEMGLRFLAEVGTPATGELRRVWQAYRPSPVPRAKPPSDAALPMTNATPEFAGAAPTATVPIAATLAPEAAATVERKTVIALVAIITEARDTGDASDPEILMQHLDPLFQALRGVVERYEGVVTTTAVNGLTAVFGAPVTHEDDAVRACYAALAMREAVQTLSQDGHVLTVGLHAGEVVVRPASAGAAAGIEPIGPVMMAAERIAEQVEPGMIALSAETARRAEGFVAVEPLGPMRIGRQEVELVALRGRFALRSRWEVRVARGLSRFVGRQAEVDLVRRALRAAEAGRGEIVAVVGEPGMGKSRLVHEVIHSDLATSWAVLETSAAPHDTNAAYLPISNLLRSWLGVEERDSPTEIARKADLTLDTGDAELLVHRPAIFALLDLPVEDLHWRTLSPQQRQRQTLAAIRTVLVRESRRHPLVLLVEDLHWIDGQTQATLDALVAGLAAHRLLLLVTYRPGYRHDWAAKSYFSQIRLDPFSADTADTFLLSLLGSNPELTEVRRMLATRTEGTPLFLEEAVRALVEAGLLTGRPSGYRLAGPIDALALPSTVQAVIAARIDRLPARIKALLQTAAVIGRDVPFALLQPIARLTEDELYDALAALQAAEFLFETRLPPDLEYSFKHALTHEVVYGSVLKERRRTLHIELVRTIEEVYRTRLDEQIERLAHHALAGELWDQAVHYLFRAADKAIQRSAHLQAAEFLNRGLAVIGRLPETPERLRRELAYHKAMGVAMMAAKGWGAQEVSDAYTRARLLCERLGDDRELFAVLRGQGQFHMIRGELQTARAIGNRCTALSAAARNDAFAIETHHLFWSNSFFMGDYASAGLHAECGIGLYRRPDHHGLTYIYSGHDPGACCRCFSGLVLWQRGYPDQAVERCQEGLRLAEEVAHPLTLALAYWALSYVHLFRREPARAQEWAALEIALCERYALPLLHSQGAVQLGWAMTARGDLHAGIARMREGLAATAATGAEMGLPYFIALLGEALAAAGEIEAGLAEVERALAAALDNGALFQYPELLRIKGELLLRRADPDRSAAEALFRTAIEAAQGQGARLPQLRAATSLARLLAAQGIVQDAARILMPLRAWFAEGHDTADLVNADRLLEALQERG
jgi:DNA-binding SARP family transcriptional activator/predicted ATPase/ABC-type thiamine transport system ATPase subunit